MSWDKTRAKKNEQTEKPKDRPRQSTACLEMEGGVNRVETQASYLSSTLAPAASSFFLISSASALEAPSLTGLGAPSTRVLGFLQAEAGDGADFLDDADLVRTGLGEDDVELGLLLGGSGAGGGGATRGSGGDSSGGGYAPLAFEVFDEGGEVQNGLRGQPLNNLVFGDVAHVM